MYVVRKTKSRFESTILIYVCGGGIELLRCTNKGKYHSVLAVHTFISIKLVHLFLCLCFLYIEQRFTRHAPLPISESRMFAELCQSPLPISEIRMFDEPRFTPLSLSLLSVYRAALYLSFFVSVFELCVELT